jgi:hypothetical protein
MIDRKRRQSFAEERKRYTPITDPEMVAPKPIVRRPSGSLGVRDILRERLEELSIRIIAEELGNVFPIHDWIVLARKQHIAIAWGCFPVRNLNTAHYGQSLVI